MATDSVVQNTKFCEIDVRFVYILRSVGKGMTAGQILRARMVHVLKMLDEIRVRTLDRVRILEYENKAR